MRLTPTQKEQYFCEGYTVVPNVFTSDEVTEMKRCFDRLVASSHSLETTQLYNGSQFVIEDGALQRVVWCGAAEKKLLDYGKDHRLLTIASQVLGSTSMEQLINQAHFKLPGDNVFFEWHQDSYHRRYGTELWEDINGKGSYVQIVTAIEDVTEDNGPLEIVPKKFEHIDDKKEIVKIAESSERVVPLLKAGDIVLFGPYTIHGSLPNTSDKSRYAFINGFALPGANKRVYPGEGSGRLIVLTNDNVRR